MTTMLFESSKKEDKKLRINRYLLSLHLVTFFILLHFSSRCLLELKFAIYYRAASLPSQASYAEFG